MTSCHSRVSAWRGARGPAGAGPHFARLLAAGVRASRDVRRLDGDRRVVRRARGVTADGVPGDLEVPARDGRVVAEHEVAADGVTPLPGCDDGPKKPDGACCRSRSGRGRSRSAAGPFAVQLAAEPDAEIDGSVGDAAGRARRSGCTGRRRRTGSRASRRSRSRARPSPDRRRVRRVVAGLHASAASRRRSRARWSRSRDGSRRRDRAAACRARSSSAGRRLPTPLPVRRNRGRSSNP